MILTDEIVKSAGILVNPENENEYAQAIKNGLAHDYFEKSLNQAKKFDWETIVASYKDLLNNL